MNISIEIHREYEKVYTVLSNLTNISRRKYFYGMVYIMLYTCTSLKNRRKINKRA